MLYQVTFNNSTIIITNLYIYIYIYIFIFIFIYIYKIARFFLSFPSITNNELFFFLIIQPDMSVVNVYKYHPTPYFSELLTYEIYVQL